MVFDSQIIGALPSTVANEYIMLSGEGKPDKGFPNVLTLPYSIHQTTSIDTMTVKKFSTKVTEKVTTYS